MYRQLNDEVKFVESNAATFRLLQLLEDDGFESVEAVAAQLAKEMQHADVDALLVAVNETLAQFIRDGLLLA
ncbi:MAG: hypothetical protein R3E67_09450 [Pseudomonadales bacterium]